jgi:hypothetical protein
MTHANAPPDPGGAPPLGRGGRGEALDGATSSRTVPGLAGHGVEVGQPLNAVASR